MKRGRPKTDFVAKARAAWNGAPPGWVAELARAANKTSQAAVANRLGYSPAVVSHVLNNAYAGDLARVEAKVRGAFMHATVGCPVLGEIGLDRCLDEQAKDFRWTSSMRARLYRACRGGCPHSRLKRD